MLFAFLLSIAHAGTILEDLDTCAYQVELRPQLASLAAWSLRSLSFEAPAPSRLALEVVHRAKVKCVGDVMVDHLGPEYPRQSRGYARNALVLAQLYLGVKRAEYQKQSCARNPAGGCGLPGLMLEIERRQFNVTLQDFFEDVERDTKSVRLINAERLATIDQRMQLSQ